MAMQIKAVILAGGLGTRLRSVLPDLPKPMAPVAGLPFIEWVLRYLEKQGVGEAILSTGYKSEKFREYFGQDRGLRIGVSMVEEKEPLGTAGGFLNAALQVPEPPEAWLVLNGDSLALAEIAPFFSGVQSPGTAGSVLALWMDDAARYGSLGIDQEGRLTAFLEKRPGASWINAGVYLVRHETLAAFPAKRPLSWEVDVFPELLRLGNTIRTHKVRAPFLDIGLPESLAQAEQFILGNRDQFA